MGELWSGLMGEPCCQHVFIIIKFEILSKAVAIPVAITRGLIHTAVINTSKSVSQEKIQN
jgi:hypothetical protein